MSPPHRLIHLTILFSKIQFTGRVRKQSVKVRAPKSPPSVDDSPPNYRILNVDQETTIYYATLRTELKKAGTPIPANDVWVAALCRQYRLPILSRDWHFDIVAGLRRIDW
jgi:predicted nucleic acid-binding protein